MPRNDKCSHRNCDGDPCKMLTPEELESGPEDVSLARQLIDEGWLSVSTKHRMVAHLPDNFPEAADLLKPEWINTTHGKEFGEWWKFHRRMEHRSPRAITQTLSVKQFRAFKKLGGESA